MTPPVIQAGGCCCPNPSGGSGGDGSGGGPPLPFTCDCFSALPADGFGDRYVQVTVQVLAITCVTPDYEDYVTRGLHNKSFKLRVVNEPSFDEFCVCYAGGPRWSGGLPVGGDTNGSGQNPCSGSSLLSGFPDLPENGGAGIVNVSMRTWGVTALGAVCPTGANPFVCYFAMSYTHPGGGGVDYYLCREEVALPGDCGDPIPDTTPFRPKALELISNNCDPFEQVIEGDFVNYVAIGGSYQAGICPDGTELVYDVAIACTAIRLRFIVTECV